MFSLNKSPIHTTKQQQLSSTCFTGDQPYPLLIGNIVECNDAPEYDAGGVGAVYHISIGLCRWSRWDWSKRSGSCRFYCCCFI